MVNPFWEYYQCNLLLRHLNEQRLRGEGVDFTLRCQEQEWKVHKCVVSAASEWFSIACSKLWKPGNDGTIDFPDETPLHIEALITFLYTGDYTRANLSATPIAFSILIQRLADKYRILHLLGQASSAFEDLLDARSLVDIPFHDQVYTIFAPFDEDLRATFHILFPQEYEPLNEEVRQRTRDKFADWLLMGYDRHRPEHVGNLLYGFPQELRELIQAEKTLEFWALWLDLLAGAEGWVEVRGKKAWRRRLE